MEGRCGVHAKGLSNRMRRNMSSRMHGNHASGRHDAIRCAGAGVVRDVCLRTRIWSRYLIKEGWGEALVDGLEVKLIYYDGASGVITWCCTRLHCYGMKNRVSKIQERCQIDCDA
jgi:hypothetical protein